MRATIRASLLIAMCAILGADAISLPSFEVGTWDLVDSDGDASWTADKFVQLKNGTFTGEGTWGGSAYTYYGEVEAHTCAKATDGTMSTVTTWWYTDTTHTAGNKQMVCTYKSWAGAVTQSKYTYKQHKSPQVAEATSLGTCPSTEATAIASGISWMSSVTRVSPQFKCIANCAAQPVDSCADPSPPPPPLSPPPLADDDDAATGIRIVGAILATVLALLIRL